MEESDSNVDLELELYNRVITCHDYTRNQNNKENSQCPLGTPRSPLRLPPFTGCSSPGLNTKSVVRRCKSPGPMARKVLTYFVLCIICKM